MTDASIVVITTVSPYQLITAHYRIVWQMIFFNAAEERPSAEKAV